MRPTWPRTVAVIVTADDLARAQRAEPSATRAARDPIALAIWRVLPVRRVAIGYSTAVVDHLHATWRDGAKVRPRRARYEWDHRELERAMVAYDAGDTAPLAALLPVTLELRQVF